MTDHCQSEKRRKWKIVYLFSFFIKCFQRFRNFWNIPLREIILTPFLILEMFLRMKSFQGNIHRTIFLLRSFHFDASADNLEEQDLYEFCLLIWKFCDFYSFCFCAHLNLWKFLKYNKKYFCSHTPRTIKNWGSATASSHVCTLMLDLYNSLKVIQSYKNRLIRCNVKFKFETTL